MQHSSTEVKEGPEVVSSRARPLGFWSGAGLVSANMIGAGVFLSAGFMAQEMGPAAILLAWVVGGLVALAGARAYAAVATLVPRSGGEYRYLSTLMHPFLGYLSGWGSLLLGFSAPVAIDALAAGAYARTLWPWIEADLFAALLIAALTAVHATSLTGSRRTQMSLSGLNVLLVTGFVVVGLCLGSNSWPTWQPTAAAPGPPVAAFMKSLFYIAFAFSGWNAAAYVAEEFAHPKRDVPRAMLAGCAAVGALYLAVNWIFVANLQPASATAVFDYATTHVTLGHVVMRAVAGELGARVMSAVTLVVFVSAASVMTLVGPRVYAAMAGDGFLPAAFGNRAGRPPAGAVILQGALALVLLSTHRLAEILLNTGALLTLFSALTALSLFRVRWARPDWPRPTWPSLACAGVHVGSVAWMLYFGFGHSWRLVSWVTLVTLAAAVAFLATRRSIARQAKSTT